MTKKPEGAVVYAHLFGPKMRTDANNHPILKTTWFDETKETAVDAVIRLAETYCGMDTAPADWKLIQESPTIRSHPLEKLHRLVVNLHYRRVYVFAYLPEQQHWTDRNINPDDLNLFKDCWYIDKK